MKKCYRYCTGPTYYRMCSTGVAVQNKPAAVAPKKPSPIISSFQELGRRKLSMQPKFVAAQKMLLKQNPANIRKWIARFYYLKHLYSAGSACIAHNNCMSCPSIWATLSTLLINILLGSFQLCIVISLSLKRSEIIPFSGVCQSGGGCIIHAGGGSDFPALADGRLMCNRRRPAATSSRRASFSALASANSFVYFASRRAATSR